MSQVISFQSYVPPARFDDEPWSDVRIEEAASSAGPWATIDTLALDPLDPDPSDPQPRSFTTDQASDGVGLWYRVVFLDAGLNESQPTEPVRNIAGTLYVSRDELKTLLGQQNETFADEAIDIAVEAASRSCDGYTRTRFYSIAETRYYNPILGEDALAIDDLVTATSVSIDELGDSTYSTEWVDGVDFYLDPPNAALEGLPSRRLVLRAQAGNSFPRYARSVRIEGTFGWAATPSQVKQATVLLANRLLTRTRQAPLGILVATANDVVATARLGKIDPDAAFLLDQIPGLARPALRSLQLG